MVRAHGIPVDIIAAHSYDLPALLATDQVTFQSGFWWHYERVDRTIGLPIVNPDTKHIIIQEYTPSECETVCTFINEGMW
jgi:hypothetical protein